MAKYKVIYDLEDFPIKKNEGGLYSILPYEKLDKHGNALFKVGLADSFASRFENYHTDYPLGFYIKNLLATPTKEKENSKPKTTDGGRPSPAQRATALKSRDKMYYQKIEKSIFADIEKNNGKRLKTTTRIRHSDEYGGDSEWFYTNEKTLDHAFNHAFKIYGGKNLDNHLQDINKIAEKNKKNSDYTAEIHYKVYH